MKITKSALLAVNALRHSKLRSWLTIIGIVIGVAAVVSIVSIGDGLAQNVQSRLGGLGADIITISPGGGRAGGGFRGGGGGEGQSTVSGKNLTKQDIQTVKSVDSIKVVGGSVSGNGEAYYLGESARVSVDGVDPLVWKDLTTMQLFQGRSLGASDYNVVVVGSRIANRTFKQPLIINRFIDINGKPFKIVGILKESGSGGDDRTLFVPINAARDTITDIGRDKLSEITLKATSVDQVDAVLAAIDEKLMTARHVTDRAKDYSIRSSKQIQENLASVTQTISLFLSAIAAVSLIVGAVGIANTMFTSVLEKTKEIGIMKAIGAKNRDILMIFLFTAALVGFTGGLLGIGIGSIISLLIPKLGVRLLGLGGGDVITVLSPWLLVDSLGLAVAIGMIAGVIPAYRASKLSPIEALRYS